MALLKKITVGFVTQTFDTDTGQFVSQDFTGGDDMHSLDDQVSFEDANGEPVDPALFGQAELPFTMVQPTEM